MGVPAATAQPVYEACRRILVQGDLAGKLGPIGVAELPARDAKRPAAGRFDTPARAPELGLSGRSAALPRAAALREARARAQCLARFAHHELMAVELFAWALLRWPDLPRAMIRDLLRALQDEQRHCRLYLGRLAAYGATLAEFPSSDYIWRHGAAAEHPRAFLCAMGLTLEQANLDFSLRFAEAFRAAGDPRSADILERVHRDEIRHVGVAARWLRALDPETPSEVERYEAAVPFPLSAARAKGRPFHAAPRRSAGLSDVFIEHVRQARSSQELAGTAP